MIEYTHVINTTQYQSLHIKGTAKEIDDLKETEILEMVAFQASATGLIQSAWKKAIKGESLTPAETEELIKTELDAKVLEVTENPEPKAWEVSVKPEPKAWDKEEEDW